MAIAKDILRIIIAFFLGMVLIAFQTVLFLDVILLNPISYYEYVNTPAYYDKLKEQIDFGLEEVARYTNIPGEVLTSAVTDTEIKDYSQTAVKEMIAYLRGDRLDYTLKYDTTKLKASIESYAKDFATQKNQPYNETLVAEVERISSMAGTRIETYTMIIDPALLKQVGVDKKMMVSSVVLLIPGLVINFMNVAGRVGLKDSYVTWVLERSINAMLMKWNLMQTLFLVIGILLMVIYLLYRRKQIKKSK